MTGLAILDFSFASVLIRLFLAVFLGGVLGLERIHKRRPAGFRTYILVCVGAVMAMLLGQYFLYISSFEWNPSVGGTTIPDVSRLGAQVINGVGFLGAATVIQNGKHQVKGLTTAAELWTVGCLGLAIGAGFYICVIPSFLAILISTSLLQRFDNFLIERSRNMNIYLEFIGLENIDRVISLIKSTDTLIYEIDIEHGMENRFINPCATFVLRLSKRKKKSELLMELSVLDFVCFIEEI